MALVRVARFTELTEARVVEAALTAAGIPVLVQNAQVGQTDFMLQYALGGFAIMVPEEEALEAARFIREHRAGTRENPAPDRDDAGLHEDPDADADDDPDGESWEAGRARRRRMGTRWVLVAIFVGPLVAVPVYLLGAVLLRLLR